MAISAGYAVLDLNISISTLVCVSTFAPVSILLPIEPRHEISNNLTF